MTRFCYCIRRRRGALETWPANHGTASPELKRLVARSEWHRLESRICKVIGETGTSEQNAFDKYRG